MQTKQKMPPEQALIYAIHNAQTALTFLQELQSEWEKRRSEHKDASVIRGRQTIVKDAFVVYISSLFDRTKNTHSLKRAYLPHKFIEEFENLDLVQKCIKHRNNRAGHQSESYGFVVQISEVLSSDIGSWLKEASYAVATRKLPLKPR